MKNSLLCWLLALLCLSQTYAQTTLSLSLPLDGTVYQQNASNQATITVRGNFNSQSLLTTGYTITATLYPLNLITGNRLAQNPVTFPVFREAGSTPQATTFYGSILAQKGWYELEVKATPTGNPAAASSSNTSVTLPLRATLRKVGVGEVFIIAGQSNAQGVGPANRNPFYPGGPSLDPGDQGVDPNTPDVDAVRVSSNLAVRDLSQVSPTNFEELPRIYRQVLPLRKAKSANRVGPTGSVLWYWGTVGAQLVQACQAPVALFNAAYGGTTVTQWATSTDPLARASGNGTYNNFPDPILGNRYQPGSPFYFLGNLIKVIGSTYGVRAVLWMQGESDTQAIFQTNVTNGSDPTYKDDWLDRPLYGNDGQLRSVPVTGGTNELRYVRNADQYSAKLAYVIKQSRSFLNSSVELPWVVAQTSRNSTNGSTDPDKSVTSAILTDGQNTGNLRNPDNNSQLLTALYQGPNTDVFGASTRKDGVHFNDATLGSLATAWVQQLIPLCGQNGPTPITLSTLGTESQASQISTDGKTLTAPDGYNYQWVADNGNGFDINASLATSRAITVNNNSVNGSTVLVNPGTYRAVLVNGTGNYIMTQSVTLPYTIVNENSCDFAVTASVGNASPSCGQGIQLYTSCQSGDCNGISYAWSGNGFSSNQQNPSLNAPSSNGQFTYTVLATRNGCSTSSSVNINVSGCTPTPPTGSCYEAEAGTRSAGTDVSSGGNASGGQYVGGFDGASRYVDITVNVASAGNYPLVFYYASGEAGGYIDYQVNNNTATRLNGIPTTGGWNQFAASNAVTIALNAGNNTIRVQGGFRFTLDKICVNGGTTTTTGCNFAVAIPTVSNANPGCSGNITLNANCNGGDCGSASFAWTLAGNNVGSGATLATTAPGSNGGYTYTVSATKAGCNPQTGPVGITVSGCTTTTPPTGGCYEAESGNRSPGTDVSSGGNASGGSYVGGFDGASRYVDITVNVASAGNYPLTFYYASGEAGGNIGYQVNGVGASPFSIPNTTGGWNQFTASNAVTVSLNAGNNTIRVQGGFRFTLDKICVNGGTTTTTPPTPPTPPVNANYASSLDVGSCQTVAGWAFNRNTPAQPITVDIYLNGQLVQGGYPATNPRPDVADYYGTGSNNRYGFSWSVPASYRNGSSLTVSVRYGGTGQEINGSPRSAGTCNGSRVAAAVSESVEDTDRGLVISPNPSSGRVSVRFVLGAGERGSVSVQSLTGAVLQSRAVVGTGAAQTEVLDMEHEPSGLYVIRVSGQGGNNPQTGRVLLMR